MNKTTNVKRNLIYTINTIYKTDKKYIFLSVLYTCVKGAIVPITLLVMQKLVNSIQVGSVDIEIVINYIILYVLLDLGTNLYDSAMTYYSKKFIMKFDLKITETLFRKIPKLSLSAFEDSKTYDVINRAQYGGGGRLIGFYQRFTTILTQTITLIGYLLILSSFRLWIVAIILILPVTRYISNNYFNIRSFELFTSRTNDQRKTWYINYLLTYGNFYKELKTYNLFVYFTNKYCRYVNRFNTEDLQLSKKSIMISSIISFFEIIIDGGLFFYCVILGFNKIILLGNVITYTRTIIDSKTHITGVVTTISSIKQESLYIDELIKFLTLPEKDDTKKINLNVIENIKLVNVSYRYPNSNKYSLKNINLEIKNNSKIALLGINGSGKTTLIKLIMGFYTDYIGEIYINNINMKDINTETILLRTSTLFQDFIKYEATLKENIGYSNLKILNNNDKIYELIEKFNLDHIIDETNKKLDLQLGTWFDEGINLSMGQWQKVALARAFAKDADLYILDEPNAAMDSITENEISKLYIEVLENKIGIIIAHKFTKIIKIVDEIVVLDNGEIVQLGSHDELISKNGIYKELHKNSIN